MSKNSQEEEETDSFNEGGYNSYSGLNNSTSDTALSVGGMDKMIKFLDQIPADWDKAYEHGAANRVNIKKINPNKNDNKTCQCCNMTIPEDIKLWPWEVRNRELGSVFWDRVTQ